MRPSLMAGAQRDKARISRHLGAAAAAVAAAVLMTWPLSWQVGDHILAAIYHWDAYTNAMIMGSRVDAALSGGPLSLYDNYFFAPLPNSIVFNENLFGLSLIFAPFYLVTGNPLLAYNLTLLSSLSLSVFFTCLLVRRLTGNGYAGVLAGVAFAFSPYVMFELGRLQLVATQWIPACFLLLHRAIEGRRLRDVVGLWACYLLQIGTCLYYAMFLVPLLVLVGAVLLVRTRPPRKLLLQLAGAGAVAAAVAIAMVSPYFTARDAFALERTLSFASSYDGKLDFFWNVHTTNRTLTALHHVGEWRGAHEEIAFPGFTVLAMSLVAIGVPLRNALHGMTRRAIGVLVLRWIGILFGVLLVTLFTHNMLVGAIVGGAGVGYQLQKGGPFPFAGRRGLYLGLLLLSIVLFLGLFPMEWDGSKVRGLYYYLHTYFPGFNGIRKVSRQAVMTTFAFAVLSSFGSAWLVSKLRTPRSRVLAWSALLAATCFELRSFPHPLVSVWAGESVPEAYRFTRSLPEEDLVTAIPQAAGVRLFRGDDGRALHNYLMLYHKHRSLNGQSSYILPVTDLVERVQRFLPDDGARRVLQSVGARHLIVHAWDLPPSRRNLPDLLAAQPEHYRQVFQQGFDSVFSLASPNDPTLALLEVPALPTGAQPIPGEEVRAHAELNPGYARYAVDGNPQTFWSGSRFQTRGQSFQLRLAQTRRVVGFEIENHWNLSELPLSFQLDVSDDGNAWRTVAEQPVLRIYREQIYEPENFVFRVVFPEPVLATQVRIRVAQPLPGHEFSIHEARLYAQEP